ncbi:MAG TPA: hypothetical protein PKI62_04705 [bacterium]|nr:hypothetical protein [bacterium]
MITVSNFFLTLAILCALGGVVVAMMMVGVLQKHGVKIKWIWLRLFIISKYFNQYREITRQETGRTGPLFTAYLIAMNAALVFAIAGLVLRAL